jgi:hypothetical protein
LHGIHWDFIYSTRFQKATHFMPSTTLFIFSQTFFRSARRLMGGDQLFMLTTQDPTPPENTERFAKKIGSASPYTNRPHLISHHPISFSSDISNSVCRKSLFHHVKNYLQQLMKSSGSSRDRPWKTCFGTGSRDLNGFLRTLVTTIDTRSTGWFTFLGFLSESEMPRLSGTLYRYWECFGEFRKTATQG